MEAGKEFSTQGEGGRVSAQAVAKEKGAKGSFKL